MMRMKKTKTSSDPIAAFAVDWGTSSCRMWAMDRDGGCVAAARSDEGILATSKAAAGTQGTSRRDIFEGVLERLGGDLMRDNPAAPVIACGMVGANIGWVEARYLEVPIGLGFSRADLTHTTTSTGRDVWIVPGLHQEVDPQTLYPDVMRGEETQLIGVTSMLRERGELNDPQTVLLPGTHTKWVSISGGAVVRFSTVMSGEMFRLLLDHSILGDPVVPSNEFHPDAFQRGLGIARAGGPGRLAAKVFAARTLLLDGEVGHEQVADLLSGILVGEEVVSALPAYEQDRGAIALCGAPKLTSQYALALEELGSHALVVGEDATAAGLASIAREAGLIGAPVLGTVGARR